jgi:hypothetical protein
MYRSAGRTLRMPNFGDGALQHGRDGHHPRLNYGSRMYDRWRCCRQTLSAYPHTKSWGGLIDLFSHVFPVNAQGNQVSLPNRDPGPRRRNIYVQALRQVQTDLSGWNHVLD